MTIFQDRISPRKLNGGAIAVVMVLLVYLTVIVRTAWLCDDAYITLRTVDNFVNGYGLTWNVTERVQAYTHPLWMFLLSVVYAVTREDYYTSVFLSLAISFLAAVFFAYKIPSTRAGAILGLSVLVFSKAYVDYSTSGLENPLTYLILVLFFWTYLESVLSIKAVFLLALIAAAGMLNRMDLFLIFVPVLVYALWKFRSRKAAIALLAGFSPFIFWEIFSLFYYGFPFPNTAYAKLATGIDQATLIAHGIKYYANSFHYDPLTLTTIIVGIIAIAVGKQSRYLPVALGIVFYLLYVIRIGGDFMSGRLLTPVFLCAAILISHFPKMTNPVFRSLTFLAIIFLGLIAPYPTILSDSKYRLLDGEYVDAFGISDERGFYFKWTGLISETNRPPHADNLWVKEGRELKNSGKKVAVVNSIGFRGFFAGPEVHIVDQLGLTEPLLSRLRVKPKVKYRAGHYFRLLPCGYLETLSSGENNIHNQDLARYYDHLSLVVKGSLFDPLRMREIWNLNTGKYTPLLKSYRFEWKCP